MNEAKRVGRPRVVETPEEFDQRVEEYRTLRAEDETPVTFTGMARHLGFVSRQSFYDYENREGFSYSVKRARLLVEEEYEKRLSGGNVAGAIFALKNHGWTDRHAHVNVSGMDSDDLRRIVAGEDPLTVLVTGRLTDSFLARVASGLAAPVASPQPETPRALQGHGHGAKG